MDTSNFLAFITEIPYLFHIGQVSDEERISGQSLSREREERTNGLIRIFRIIIIHTTSDAVKHRIGILIPFFVDILIPSYTKCRLVIQQPCYLAACHFVTYVKLAARRIINATLVGYIASCGKTEVNLSLTQNLADNASGMRARERIISPMTIAHAGNINHLTYQTARIGG